MEVWMTEGPRDNDNDNDNDIVIVTSTNEIYFI